MPGTGCRIPTKCQSRQAFFGRPPSSTSRVADNQSAGRVVTMVRIAHDDRRLPTILVTAVPRKLFGRFPEISELSCWTHR